MVRLWRPENANLARVTSAGRLDCSDVPSDEAAALLYVESFSEHGNRSSDLLLSISVVEFKPGARQAILSRPSDESFMNNRNAFVRNFHDPGALYMT